MNHVTKKVAYVALGLAVLAASGAGLLMLFPLGAQKATPADAEAAKEKTKLEKAVETKRARHEYFQRLKRDPATGQVPPNIRARELEYARTLPERNASLAPGGAAAQAAPVFSWTEAGPTDVGGRLRALQVDEDDASTVLAGGVSGGMWKSTDGGASWRLTTTTGQRLSVTSLAQDPTSPGNDTWYYASGEYQGNSASDRGYTARFLGGGIYKSTDNGETWDLVADSNDPTAFDTPFDYVSRLIVSPTTGDIFIASNAFGIFRSTDGGQTFDRVLGDLNDHAWSDVVVASDGTLLATLSEEGFTSNPANSPGVYVSTDDGGSWTNVTPSSFPSSHERSRAAFAPSNPDVAYVLTNEPAEEAVRLHRFDLSAAPVSASDRSANLPGFGGQTGDFHTQGDYNMALAVKPDDPNFVIAGGRNLYRSTDGFATMPDPQGDWIGGYTKDDNNPRGPFAPYDPAGSFEHHPDQHALAFDPTDPDQLWSGHDGGLTVTDDVTRANDVLWEDRNNGFNVTQFYTVALPDEANDTRIAGGTQDNGTPYFRTTAPGNSTDVTSGDGSYAYFGDIKFYGSTQNGNVERRNYNSSGAPFDYDGNVEPSGASGQLFINPFVVDPNNEEIMYYPAGADLWRNTSLSTTDQSSGWAKLTSLPDLSGCEISAMGVSQTPASVLYYGASCGGSNPPRLFRMDNATTATSATEISIAGLPNGAYIHSIAVNPNDADEVLAVHSNYNIVGLYRSTDGGQNWTAVEGNLEGSGSNPGPSLRSATILPTPQKTGYLLGTSTGIYSTTTFSGGSTTWEQEAASTLGNAVVEYVTSRPSDQRVAAGSHGRGIFLSQTNALPVELAGDFGGVSEGGDVVLTWRTLSETNNDRFRILQKKNDSFVEVGTESSRVQGGTTNAPQDYRHRVEGVTPGRHTFRLVQVDRDDTERFGAETTVEVGVEGEYHLSKVYPNPVRKRARLDLTVAVSQHVTAVLFDATGRRVRTLHDGTLEAGSPKRLSIEAGTLASGVYVVRVTGETFTQTRTLTLVR